MTQTEKNQIEKKLGLVGKFYEVAPLGDNYAVVELSASNQYPHTELVDVSIFQNDWYGLTRRNQIASATLLTQRDNRGNSFAELEFSSSTYDTQTTEAILKFVEKIAYGCAIDTVKVQETNRPQHTLEIWSEFGYEPTSDGFVKSDLEFVPFCDDIQALFEQTKKTSDMLEK